MDTVNQYMKGHKVPLHDETAGFALAVYLDECQRLLRPTAQAVADQMKAEYVETFYNDITGWKEIYPSLTKGFRNRSKAPLWAQYWEDNDPSSTPEGIAIRTPYVKEWLLDHPVIHQVIGFELNLALFEQAEWLDSLTIFRMKKNMRDSLAKTTGLKPNEVRDLTHGKHAAHSLLMERTGPYTLSQERALIHAGLVFVARYCPGPGQSQLKWEDALDLVQNTQRGDSTLRRLNMSHTFTDHSDAIAAVQPYIRAFLRTSETSTESLTDTSTEAILQTD